MSTRQWHAGSGGAGVDHEGQRLSRLIARPGRASVLLADEPPRCARPAGWRVRFRSFSTRGLVGLRVRVKRANQRHAVFGAAFAVPEGMAWSDSYQGETGKT
jgi:hypothetical protein